MNKLCKLCAPDLPEISLNFTCACCESHIEKRESKDGTDLASTRVEQKSVNEPEGEDTTCCCFRRKRQAKSKCNRKSCHGKET